jgi:hypothetical protein
MSDPAEQPTQILGQAGEACRSCGAPLAVDQRYCLNCGQRRAGPRVDYRPHLSGQAGASTAAQNGQAPPRTPAAEQPEARKPERDYTPLAAVGGIAVLGLMLLVGVLIGKENGSGSSSTPAPIVLQKGSEEEAGGSETTADTGEAKSKAQKNAAAATKPAKKADDASSLTGGNKGGGPVEASDKALEELEHGGNYSEESAKLPDEIATGGAPPPEDDKTPGGGSKGTAIE